MATYRVFAHDANGLPIGEVTIEAIDLDNWPNVVATAVTDHRGYAAFEQLDGTKTYYFRPVSPRGDQGARAVGVQVYLEGAAMKLARFEPLGTRMAAVGSLIHEQTILSDKPATLWYLNQAGKDFACPPTEANTRLPGTTTGGSTDGPFGDDNRYSTNTGTASTNTSIPAGSEADLNDPLTIEVWLKRNRTGVVETVLEKNQNGYELYFDAQNRIVLAKSMTADLRRSTAQLTDTSGWHHIVATRSGTDVRIYLDGQDVTDTTYGDPSQQFNTGVASTLFVFLRGTDSTRRFQGSIAAIAVYPSALSASRILEHYRLMQTHKSATVSNGTSITVSNLFVPNRPGRVALVMFWYRSDTSITPTVTVGGKTATLWQTVANTTATPNLRGALFYVLDAAAGLQNVSVTWGTAVDALVTAVALTDISWTLGLVTPTTRTENAVTTHTINNIPLGKTRMYVAVMFTAADTAATFSDSATASQNPYVLRYNVNHPNGWATTYHYRFNANDSAVRILSVASNVATISASLDALSQDVFTFPAPVGVSAVFATIVGGGASGAGTGTAGDGRGGGGGEGVWRYPIPITGSALTVAVGRGGGASRTGSPYWITTSASAMPMIGGGSSAVMDDASGFTITAAGGNDGGNYGISGGGTPVGADASLNPMYAGGGGGGGRGQNGGRCGFPGGSGRGDATTGAGGGGGGPFGPGGDAGNTTGSAQAAENGVGGSGGGGVTHDNVAPTQPAGAGGGGLVLLEWTA